MLEELKTVARAAGAECALLGCGCQPCEHDEANRPSVARSPMASVSALSDTPQALFFARISRAVAAWL